MFEGEEEIGSPNLEQWVRAHAAGLAADVAVISDTAMVAPGQPSIVYGLRGLAYLEVEVTGPLATCTAASSAAPCATPSTPCAP